MVRLFISFSGGETSAFMTQWLMANSPHKQKVVVFANTGEENEETLIFVERCSQHFGWPVVWVEAVVNDGKGVGTTHRIVNFKTASRHGGPFEAMIAKYGIPNSAFPHCTRELKQRPLTSYMRSLGWKAGTYETAIGIRQDEFDRMSPTAKSHGIIYPLVGQMPMTKSDINSYWRDMPFRLQLKEYEGNCKWCWKKSLRKHLTIMQKNPEHFDFPHRMEQIYGVSHRSGKRVTFFRNHLSTKDLKEMALRVQIIPADDDSVVYGGKQHELDFSGSCSESCEVDFAGVTPEFATGDAKGSDHV